ncbi:hypothetical protein ABZ439_20585 [Streptomyces sp. NPDC005840]|uniref:hypothetical protein n=1 Tax=Streptomyces sp. NPDC005840 TaxID=3157072 RepID=UPI00340CE860
MNTARGRQPVGRERGDVTRYLCAGAYLDDAFADRVVEEILFDEASAVAPAPDVDLVAVVHHSLAAQDLHNRRDLRLTLSFLLVAVAAPLWLVLLLLLRVPPRPAARSRSTRGRRLPDGGAAAGVATAAGTLAALTVLLGLTVTSLPLTGFASWLFGSYGNGIPAALAFLAALATAYATVVRHDLDVDRVLRTTLTRETYDPRAHPAAPPQEWIAQRLAAIAEARDGNVTVYSGFSPWAGYPQALVEWPLTVPLLPASDAAGSRSGPGGTEPFTVPQLVAHVREQLHRAVHPEGPADAAPLDPGDPRAVLVVEDRVFVNGTTVGDDERFIRDTALAPAARLPAEEVERIMLDPTGAVRHHLAVQLPLWGGDIVPTVFLHFATVGRTLHLRLVSHLLGPVRAGYHRADRLRGPLDDEARRGLLLEALRHTGARLAAAPLRADRHSRFESRHDRRMTEEIKAMEEDPEYDYGARTSIRAMAASPVCHNYFQIVDAERVLSLVQRHTLAAVAEFLDARGYDTTDFREQQQTILNQGIIQQGGLSVVGNQAVGPDATAIQHVPRQGGAGTPAPAARATR